MIKDTVLDSKAEERKTPRLFAKRPTQVATNEHVSLPLHVQNPPVPFLCYTKADEIMKLGANRGDELFWAAGTAVYRSEEAAYAAFANRSVADEVNNDAILLANDLDTFYRANSQREQECRRKNSNRRTQAPSVT